MDPSPTGAAVADIDFLARSEHRVGVLSALTEDARERHELQAETGASSPTLGRILADFEDRRWITRDGEAYRLTPLGRFVADGFLDLCERMESEGKLRDVWRWLPREMEGFSVDLFADAVVSYPGPGYPYEPVERVTRLIEDATEMRGFGTTVFKSINNEAVCQAVVEGMEYEYVFSSEVLEATIAWDPERVAEAARQENCTIFLHDDLPDQKRCGIGIFDDRVGICCHDARTGILEAVVDTAAPEAREWALAVYEKHRAEARPLSPREAADLFPAGAAKRVLSEGERFRPARISSESGHTKGEGTQEMTDPSKPEPPPKKHVSELREGLRGPVLLPGEEGYDEARTIWNAMIDKHPAVVARCTGAADVVEAVTFAREHDLPLAVKGGGHNVAGNSLVDDGLVVDLSLMSTVRVDPVEQTARVGAGARIRDLDHEAQAFGLATPAGFHSTTGVAGLTLGGGFGWLSRKHGMTVDNLLSVDVVTADGELLQASEDENPDLFWAVRGGGGNFGVVTSFEFDLHEVGPEILAGVILHPTDDAGTLVRRWRDFVADIPNELTVWALVLNAPPFPWVPEEHHGEEVLAIVPVYDGDLDAGRSLVEPLREFGDPIADDVKPRPYLEWQRFFDAAYAPGARNYWKSLNFAEFTDETIDTCLEYAQDRPSPQTKFAMAHLGGATTDPPQDATAYPHRDAEFVVNIVARWEDPGDDDDCIAWARDAHDALKEFSTDGTYVNFISEETGEEAFAYRGNYDRLAELKARYDPENVFQGNQNIEPPS